MIGRECVLLLCGGDKRKQSSDIDRALEYLKDYKDKDRILMKRNLTIPRNPQSDAAAVWQHGAADRWTAASVGIAQAAAPKKTIPISLGNGELSEKLVLEAGATGFQEPWKTVGSRWDRLGENIVFGELSWRKMEIYFQSPTGQKRNSG